MFREGRGGGKRVPLARVLFASLWGGAQPQKKNKIVVKITNSLKYEIPFTK